MEYSIISRKRIAFLLLVVVVSFWGMDVRGLLRTSRQTAWSSTGASCNGKLRTKKTEKNHLFKTFSQIKLRFVKGNRTKAKEKKTRRQNSLPRVRLSASGRAKNPGTSSNWKTATNIDDKISKQCAMCTRSIDCVGLFFAFDNKR